MAKSWTTQHFFVKHGAGQTGNRGIQTALLRAVRALIHF
jgi:hypothetical protein